MSRGSGVSSSVMLLAVAVCGLGCEPDLDTTRDVPDRGSFGQIIYRESCERVAWTSQLDDFAAGVMSAPLDVSASIYGPVCIDDVPPPDDAPARLRALTGEKSTIVSVVDLVLPDSFLQPLESFLEAIEVLDDDGTMETTIASAADLMQRLIDDDGFAPALGRISGRDGFRPASVAGGLPHAIFGFAQLDALLDDTLNLLLDDDGNAKPELDQLLTTLALELGASQPVANAADPNRTLAVALGLLYAPSTEAAPANAPPRLIAQRDPRGVAIPTPDPRTGGVPAPFLDPNKDKQAEVDPHGRLVGAPALPFALPGKKDPAGVKRDAQGRLLDGNGKPVYLYRDLEGTVLAALVREQGVLADPNKDDLLGLVFGATGLAGPRVTRTKKYVDAKGSVLGTLSYKGFDVTTAALLDLAHAYVQLLGAPRARDLLLAARTLLANYESPAARSVAAMLDASDRGRKYMNAQIPEASTLYDELVPIIVRVLEVPGLASDLLKALQDPHVKGLAAMIAAQVNYKDRFVLDQQWQTVSGKWQTPVAHEQPDVGWNRSIMQRMLHLVHDANGVQFCNKEGAALKLGIFSLKTYHRCEMFRVDDLGLFFALTIASRSITDDPNRYATTRSVASFREHIVDDFLKTAPLLGITDDSQGDANLQNMVGIDGFTRFPTPEAAVRCLFLDSQHQSTFMQNSIDPVTCSDGERFIDVHNDSMFAWEVPIPNNPSSFPNDSFYDAVRPVIDAFAKHDECAARDQNGTCTRWQNAAKIFLDLLSVLHRHWGSVKSAYSDQAGNPIAFQSTDPNKARYSTGDGVVSYEALLDEVLGQGDLVPSLINLSPVLLTMTLDGTPNTQAALPVLLSAASYVFDPAAAPASLAYRDGHTATTWNDGKTPVPRATPYYMIAEAYAKKRLQFAAAPDAGASWKAATSDLVDDALTVESPMANTWRMKNRRMHGVTLALLDFLRARLDAHGVAGDQDDWVRHQLTQDLADTVSGPTFAAAADLVAKIESDPSTIQKLYALLQSFADDSPSGAFGATLTTAGDLVQTLLDDPELVPIAHGVGKVLDPASLAPLLRFMKHARKLDPNKPPSDGNDAKKTTLVTILGNFYKAPAGGAVPMSDLADALAEINRVQPGAGTDLDAADYRNVLAEVQSFLTDEERGFLKFVAIVKNRRAPAQ